MADVTELTRKQFVGLEAELADITPAEGDTFCATNTGNVYHGCSGNWVLTSGAATKYHFFSADYGGANGDYRIRVITTAGSHQFTFVALPDFNALVALRLIGICSAGAAGVDKDIDLQSDYGADGESKTTHSESDVGTLYDFTGMTDKHITIDASGVFSALAAGDRCGLQVDHNTIGGSIDYLGIEMEYT